MSKITSRAKLNQGRGLGDGYDYKPFIKTRELNSRGTCSNFIDWKTGRQMEFLSQTELHIFMQLRWDDDVLDIKEQYPLDLDKLNAIINEANSELKAAGHDILKIRYNEDHWLTTDFVLSKTGGETEAVSVKYNKENLRPRDIETVWIEKKYWDSLGHKFRLMDKSDVNPILIKNLRLVTEYYDKSRVFDYNSLIKHLIATKQLDVDIENEVLDLRNLSKFIGEKQEWAMKLESAIY